MADDPIRPFESTPATKPGLVSRFLGRLPRASVFAEVRSMLATTPFEQVRHKDVSATLAKAKLICRDVPEELARILEHAALLLAQDHDISEQDRKTLASLQAAFELTDSEAATAIATAVGHVFEGQVRQAFASGTFSTADRRRLEAAGDALGMTQDQVVRIYQPAAEAAFHVAMQAAVADRRYTTDEETTIHALAKDLGFVLKQDEQTAAVLAKFRLLAQIDAGHLPVVIAPILLRRNEACHFSAVATHQQIKSVTTRINYDGPTASIKLMKGVHWRMGSIGVHRMSQDVMTVIDTGTLYVTSSRLLFDGGKKNSSIPLAKITNFVAFKDGLQIEKDSGPDQCFFSVKPTRIGRACLDGAVRSTRQ